VTARSKSCSVAATTRTSTGILASPPPTDNDPSASGGHLGGAPLGRAALRVTIGGALAMAVTAAIGRLFGVVAG
jgi:hypothetical protein